MYTGVGGDEELSQAMMGQGWGLGEFGGGNGVVECEEWVAWPRPLDHGGMVTPPPWEQSFLSWLRKGLHHRGHDDLCQRFCRPF